MRIIYAILVSSLLLLTACENDGPAENVGERVDEAARDTRDAVEDAADEIEDEVD